MVEFEVNSPVIEAVGLKKEFSVSEQGKGFAGAVKALFSTKKRIVRAVDGVGFSIQPGEFVGYAGENGAGKSTTIKILTGILVPSAGTATVRGVVPYRDRKANAANIGVVFGQRTQLWWDLPTSDSFEMLRAIYRIKRGDYADMMKKLSDVLDLGPLMSVPVRKLSLGQRMKCDIAASLIHRPKVLFLDEPTIGLDVVAKENIRQFLGEINRTEGTTIILTTHDMNDIERLCARLIILDKGRVIYDGLTEGLRQRFGHEKVLEVEFDGRSPAKTALPNLEIVAENGSKISFKYLEDGRSGGLAAIIGKLAADFPVKDILVREPSVEVIIRSIYEKTVSLPPYDGQK
ncbi:MAG: ATP-binding cassette domain-containing protein [Nitrospinae bacterium]|nr:ATP-binding cassette domain-containing protein [Nitrospinota bacterium]